jgi:predicted  nucleic acid-binding Zn-ribbon protein
MTDDEMKTVREWNSKLGDARDKMEDVLGRAPDCIKGMKSDLALMVQRAKEKPDLAETPQRMKEYASLISRIDKAAKAGKAAHKDLKKLEDQIHDKKALAKYKDIKEFRSKTNKLLDLARDFDAEITSVIFAAKQWSGMNLMPGDAMAKMWAKYAEIFSKHLTTAKVDYARLK